FSLSSFFTAPVATVFSTLSLHDALPIYGVPSVAALRDVLAPDRLRDVPGRLHLLRLHPELAARRAPVVAPEADRVGGDERRLGRSEEHTSELQSRGHLVCRLLLEKKKKH